MARYTGSVCRLCRREGTKLFLKGDALLHQEVRLRAPPDAARPARRPPPQGRRVRPPAAREAEGPPRSTASSSASSATTSSRREHRPGVTGENLLRSLEMRLDNVVYRMGFAALARPGAPARRPRPLRRQRPADQHPVATSSSPATGSRSARRRRAREPFKIAKETLRSAPGAGVADRRCRPSSAGPSSRRPARDQMPLDLNEQLVVEYYSR